MQQALYFVHGARTPFAKFKGSFRQVTTLDLAVSAGQAALERARVCAREIDNVVVGCVHQASHTDGILLARHVALRVGADMSCPALTVNRLCGSGMQALVSAAQAMLLGESQVALVGGAENMTQVPFVLRGLREGLELGGGRLEDLLWESLLDSHAGCTMADTA
ncbi:MAG: acetyl-CoA C-acyltransferase, partial [Alicyclobacillus sp.]|nr:acetyl-CoA C-acyltransferase [Alicyclobacillus sp.]